MSEVRFNVWSRSKEYISHVTSLHNLPPLRISGIFALDYSVYGFYCGRLTIFTEDEQLE